MVMERDINNSGGELHNGGREVQLIGKTAKQRNLFPITCNISLWGKVCLAVEAFPFA